MARRLFVITFTIVATVSHAFAGYIINTLTSFPGTTVSNNLQPGVIVSGNTIIGVNVNNGGTVYSLPTSGGTLTTLSSFSPTTAGTPQATPILVGSTLYGTGSNPGAVYSVPVTGGPLTRLASVTGPSAGVAAMGSNLYGLEGLGDIFSEPITGGTPTVLASLDANTFNTLLISGNTIYGVASAGVSTDQDGFVFSLPITGGTPTILGVFNGANGQGPHCTLLLSGNTLYGTTNGGGSSGDGVVFSLPVTGGTPIDIATFNGVDGASPTGTLALVGNTLYGTTLGGGPNFPTNNVGVVFSVPITGGTPSVVAPFDNVTGTHPWAGLTAVGSTFYAATRNGGTNNAGTVISVVESLITLSDIAPTSFGGNIATLTPQNPSQTFSASTAGYSSAALWNSPTQAEVYGLNITDSNPANLAADLSALAAQINGESFSEFSVSATTTDPTGGALPGSYNLFLTFTNIALNSPTTYFGFDLTQFTANSDTLRASAVAAVPEPATAAIALVFGANLLLTRRRVAR
jgi:uncharacterized repeat protein (TIGR03803 family)